MAKYRKKEDAFNQGVYNSVYMKVKNILDKGEIIDLENLPPELEKKDRYVRMVLDRLCEEGIAEQVVEA